MVSASDFAWYWLLIRQHASSKKKHPRSGHLRYLSRGTSTGRPGQLRGLSRVILAVQPVFSDAAPPGSTSWHWCLCGVLGAWAAELKQRRG